MIKEKSYPNSARIYFFSFQWTELKRQIACPFHFSPPPSLPPSLVLISIHFRPRLTPPRTTRCRPHTRHRSPSALFDPKWLSVFLSGRDGDGSSSIPLPPVGEINDPKTACTRLAELPFAFPHPLQSSNPQIHIFNPVFQSIPKKHPNSLIFIYMILKSECTQITLILSYCLYWILKKTPFNQKKQTGFFK